VPGWTPLGCTIEPPIEPVAPVTGESGAVIVLACENSGA
jgi:hypothetical protein